MAEFETVMHEMKRMCDAFNNKDECWKCPLSSNSVCGTPSNMDYEAIRKGEAAIMAWAAEHPEPTYPTWYAWLKDMGLTFHDAESSWIGFTERIHHPIPAEIAEKLGIEPKEG